MESTSSPTSAWAYFVAKFSSELLLFELIAIFTLIAIYTAYWVLKKRRIGAVQDQVPSNVVKAYLNELISQAYFVRKQLFGLLADAGVSLPEMGAQSHGGPSLGSAAPMLSDAQSAALIAAAQKIATSPELNSKMGGLESKLTDQTKAMEQLLQEKIKLENELASAIAAGAGGGGKGAPAVDTGELTGLKKKVKELEERLAEYSVIEDDLANLKRLQQENAKLKEMLGAGGAKGATSAAPVSAAPTPAATLTPAAVSQPDKSPSPANEPKFDELANQVQESLKAPQESPKVEPKPEPKIEPKVAAAPAPVATPAPVAAPTPAPATAAPVTPAPAATPMDNIGKSDEDLLSEFEKMLNM